jgi:FkbM family methyltransferase
MKKRFNVNPKRVLHGGAHMAEELESYAECEFSPGGTVWVEANPVLANELSARLEASNNVVMHVALWSKSDLVMDFHETSNSQSASLLKLGTHSDNFPDIVQTGTISVKTKRIDELPCDLSGVDFINLDIQGAELEAIKGAERILGQIKWIYTEVNKAEVYVGCAKVWEIDEYLKTFGYSRIATRWSFQDDFGDALYSKDRQCLKSTIFKLYELLSTLNTSLRYLAHSLKSKFTVNHQ